MCLRPRKQHLADGRTVQTACQECRQCRDQRVLDWVGRCIAESKVSAKAHAVTLTYGRDENGNEDHPRAKVLTYSDVQKWFKLLRRHGYPCRYFLSGEYGPSKGRTHWHFIVFWVDKVPNWSGFDQYGNWSDNHLSHGAHKVRFNHQRLGKDGKPAIVNGEPAFWWPHGWTEVSEGASVDAIKYVCKYILKDVAADKQSQFMMSKNPPLGAGYFMQRAERYVAAGLAPQGGMGYLTHPLYNDRLMMGMGGYKYSWSEVTTKSKEGVVKPVEFQLKGVSLELFLAHYVAAWELLRPGQLIPASILVEEFLSPGSWKDRKPLDRPLALKPNNPPVSREAIEAHLEKVRWRLRNRDPYHGDVDQFHEEWDEIRPLIFERSMQIAVDRAAAKARKQNGKK